MKEEDLIIWDAMPDHEQKRLDAKEARLKRLASAEGCKKLRKRRAAAKAARRARKR